MGKGLIIFIEGDTEEAFYKKLVTQLHEYTPNKRFKMDTVKIKNLKGIGNYKKKAARVVREMSLNQDTKFSVALCYDTDVFDLSPKPPITWSDVERVLMEIGAEKVIHIKARHSIEDWFLLDKEGLCRYLRLPETTHIGNGTGIKIIEALFKKGHNVYIKGRTQDFVDSLDVNKIMISICSELKSLCNELGIECTNQRKKCK
ncbi:MAG TPA: hypothetical protein DDW50_01265 [Firmicutes bacterium]|jgi:hypothetical protein|nr:hypothetical protein [Bacillota bacterium]